MSFFRLSIFAFEVGERYVQRLVPQPDSNGVHRYTFFMQRVGIGFSEPMKFGALDTSLLGNGFQLAQKVSVRFALAVRKHKVVRLGVALSHSVLEFA